MRVHGNEYANNDILALEEDLESLSIHGFTVVPLASLVKARCEGSWRYSGQRVAAVTCDDGSDFDFVDLPHPTAGPQRSVLSVLRAMTDSNPLIRPHVTSFVIASPEARSELDKSCMIGKGWWNDSWWPRAVESGLMHIANHSWDHNHDALPTRFFGDARRGTFLSIDSKELADFQIDQAGRYIRQMAPNPGDRLFAYPYGEANEYLREEYFPRYGSLLGIDAAIGDGGEPVSLDSDLWNLPRYAIGKHWKSPDEFRAILRDVV